MTPPHVDSPIMGFEGVDLVGDGEGYALRKSSSSPNLGTSPYVSNAYDINNLCLSLAISTSS